MLSNPTFRIKGQRIYRMTTVFPKCMCVLEPHLQGKLNGWMTPVDQVTGSMCLTTMDTGSTVVTTMLSCLIIDLYISFLTIAGYVCGHGYPVIREKLHQD